MSNFSSKKIIILHDWLDTKAGAENVLEQILKIFPNADIFTIVDFMPADQRSFLKNHKIYHSIVQHFPFAKNHFRKYFPLFPVILFFYNFSKYDLIVSSSHSYVKNIRKSNNQIHICNCYTPVRYCYDQKSEYINDYAKNIFIKIFLYLSLFFIRLWDQFMSKNVDYFISISNHISNRIMLVYSRQSYLIYPSIDLKKYFIGKNIKKKDYYVAASRFVPYKRLDLVIEAFNKMPDRKLIIIGSGEKFIDYKKLANKNIIFKGRVSENVKIKIFSEAKALIYPAYEDFGIVPVESQSCGTPVIGFDKGGLKDTVITSGSGKTGILFKYQTANAIIKSINFFESNISNYSSVNCFNNAKRFDHTIFRKNFKAIVCDILNK